MLKLPVTLTTIATVHHKLARMALEDSMRDIEFEDVIVFADKKEAVPDGATWVKVNISNMLEYNSYLWYGLPFHINTLHFLLIQWDGFVINPQGWRNEFLGYDYIGAPWPDYIVGNGGFSLRSIRLAKFIASNPCTYKLSHPEDRAICDYYAERLTKAGIRFPNKSLASHFSFEGIINKNAKDVFGFHGPFNFPRVLKGDKLWERMKLFDSEAGYTRRNIELIIKSMISEGQQLGYMKHEQERTQAVSSA